ncbi:type I glutamate--ammonia ligase [Bacillus mangrovi]|uniref:Glutamine synthetase n=1 Tax=Metabacillus mangrovi TaxID=1491830 RepID=A0A7X2V4J3_9BACI|nr:type I glutamate--ammonia ligase [Metabacillus mangrovi]MTH53445.1 type I glutamate--ammonia ligase [Metabacillus mangrovi]
MIQLLEDERIESVKEMMLTYKVDLLHLQFVDIEGILKHVTITADQFEDAVEGKIMFDGSSIKGFSPINRSDLFLQPDLDSFAIIPWSVEKNYAEARFLCQVKNPDGTPYEGDSRNVLIRSVENARKFGYTISIGPELEFFLFQMDQAGNPTVHPHDKGGYFEPSHDLGEKVRLEIYRTLKAMGFKIEASHHEVAMGQHEINFQFRDALASADNATTYKWIVKTVAKQHNLHASFMPKPVQGTNGSGMHVNISLFKDGENMFYDEKDERGLSESAYFFIRGLLDHVEELTAITNPVVNSYKRIVPGYEAPCYIAWSACNRSSLIRIPSKRGAGTRVEVRHPDPSANPYLAYAVIAEAGLSGIGSQILPEPPIEEDIFAMTSEARTDKGIVHLPNSLEAALNKLEAGSLARTILGSHVYEQFTALKKAEWESFKNTVHAWELEHYHTKF